MNSKYFRIFICLMAAVLLFSMGCTKAPHTEGTPTQVPTATPEPTPEPPIDIGLAITTPEPEPVTLQPSSFVISDADVDFIMMDHVDSADGFTVVTVEYEGQSIFYVLPEEGGEDVTTAIGSVIMSFDADKVNALNCQVHLDSLKKNEEKIRTLYDYYLNTFPLEVVGNLDEAAWQEIRNTIKMEFDDACSTANSGRETRDLYGQFVFHVANNLISFDFYAY